MNICIIRREYSKRRLSENIVDNGACHVPWRALLSAPVDPINSCTSERPNVRRAITSERTCIYQETPPTKRYALTHEHRNLCTLGMGEVQSDLCYRKELSQCHPHIEAGYMGSYPGRITSSVHPPLRGAALFVHCYY